MVRSLSRFLVIGVILAACLAVLRVCTLSYSVERIAVRVVDPESGTPVEGARIEITYLMILLWPVFNPPPGVDVRTDLEGRAEFQIADLGSELRITRPGYIDVWVPTEPRDGHLHPRHYEESDDGERRITVPLYRAPEPSVTVVLPDGYRGPVAVELRPSDRDVQASGPQRESVFEADARGRVVIEASPLLYEQRTLLDLDARFTSGRSVGETVDASSGEKVSFVKVEFDARRLRALFVVGTKADHERLRAEVHRPTAPDVVVTDWAAFERYFVDPPGEVR